MKRRALNLLLVACSLILGSCSHIEEIESESIVTKEEYNINFYHEDRSTLLYSTVVEEGVLPVYKGGAPVKTESAFYTYTFSGWTPKIKVATQNQNYYAVFEEHMKEQKALSIVRVSPGIDSVTIEVVSEDKPYTLELLQNNRTISVYQSDKPVYTIENLTPNVEYGVIAKNPLYSSDLRRFIPGDYRFTPINYLNPNDTCYQDSGRFLGSPCLIEFKGNLFTMMDVFGNNHSLSMLYVSKNDGKDWRFVKYFRPAQWGSLFVYNNTLYFVATDLLTKGIGIFVSEDGFSWSEQNRILDGYFVTSPTTIEIINDKIYFATSERDKDENRTVHVLIGDGTKDLTKSSSWTLSSGYTPPFSLGGDQTIHYAEEGNVVEYNGNIYALYRFAYKKALMMKLEGTSLNFYKVINMECGWCKFVIRKLGDTYYAMGNHTCYPRNLVRLYKSTDLENWQTVKVIEDIQNIEDIERNGIQYPYFIIKNNKFYTLLRIALNEADTFHNSNAIGFKIIPLD